MLKLSPCASSARAMRLQPAWLSQSDAQPLGVQPPRRGLKQTARKVADSTAFGHLGGASLELLEGKPMPGVIALDDAP